MVESRRDLNAILNLLDSNSLDERLKALKELENFDGNDVVEHFIRMLRDNSSEVQIKAAEALIKYKDRRSVPQLIETLSDNNKEVKKRVIYVLGELKDKTAVLPLLELLSDPRGTIRREVIGALGKLGDESAVEPLINVLDDENKYVRIKAVKVLGELGDERAIDPLVQRLKDNSVDVKVETLLSLRELEDSRSLDSIIELFGDPNPIVRKEAVKTARIVGDDRAIDSFLNMLKDSVLEVRIEAVEALADINDQRCVDGLIELLDDTNWKIRGKVIDSFRKLGKYDVIDRINEKCITDSNPEIRKNFLEFLGESSDERYVDSISSLIKDENREVRSCVVKYFNNIGSEKVINHLIEFLQDNNLEIRVSAIEALGNISSEKSAESLLNMLENEKESYIKIAIIQAIDNIGNINHIERLKYLLKDEDPTVREKVAQMLKKNNLLNYEHFYEAAKGYFRDKKYKDTIDCLRKIEHFSDNDPEMIRMEAYSSYYLENYDRARELFNKIISISGETNEILEILSNIEKVSGNFEKSMFYLEKLKDSGNEHVTLFEKMAQLSENIGDKEKAFDNHLKCYRNNSNNRESNIFLFNFYLDKEPEKAFIHFDKIIENGVIEKDVYIRAANYYFENNNIEKSYELCKTLEDNGLFDNLCCYFYVMYFINKKDNGEIRHYVERLDILSLSHENQKYVTELISNLLEYGMFEKAVEFFDELSGNIECGYYVEILKKFYNNLKFDEWLNLYRQGKEYFADVERYNTFILSIFLNRKDYSLFDKYYGEIAEKFGKDSDILLSMSGDYNFSLHNYNQCIDIYKQIYNVLTVEQLEKLCLAYIATGDIESALAEYKLLFEKTGNKKYETVIAELYINNQQYEKASLITQEILKNTPESSQAYLLLGKIYYAQDAFSEALTSFKRSLDLDRNNPGAMLGLAKIYIEKEIFEEAYLMLNEVKEEYEENREYFDVLLYYYEKQGKFKDSKILLKELLEEQPEDNQLKFRLIKTYFELGELDKAINSYKNLNFDILKNREKYEIALFFKNTGMTDKAKNIISQLIEGYAPEAEYLYTYSLLDPKFALDNLLSYLTKKEYEDYKEKLNYAYVNSLIINERFEEAGVRLGDLIEKNPENPDFLFLKAYLYYNRKSYDKALKMFEKTVLISSNHPKAYFYVAKIYRNKKQYEKALAYLIRLKKESGYNLNIEYTTELSEIYFKLEKYQEALECVEKVLEVEETDALVFFKGKILFNNRKFIKAQEVFERLCLNNPENVEYFEYAGYSASKNKMFDKAVSYFRKCIELEDNNKFRRELAIALQKMGRNVEAAEFFDKLKGDNIIVDDLELVYHQGLSEFLKGNYNDSLAYVNRLIKKGKKSFNILLLAARNYMKKEQYEKSISYYELVEEELVKDAELSIEYSLAFERMGNIDKAIFVLEKVVSLNDERIFLRLSHLYFSRNMYDESLENIDQVLLLYPKDKEALNLKGLIYEKQEMFENSLVAYELSKNLFKLGSLNAKLHKYEKALKYFDQLLEKDPEDFEALCFKAIIFKETGKYNDAIEILKQVESMYPEKSDSYSLLGTIYELIEDTENAVENYEKMIELEENNIEGYFKIASLYKRKEKLEDAKKWYKKVLEMDPENIGAISELSEINVNLENYREAEKLLKMLIEKEPEYENSYIELAKIYIKTGKYSEGVLLLKNLGESENQIVSYLLAKMYYLMKNYDFAYNCIKEAISENPDYTDAYMLLADITEKMGKDDEGEFALKKVITIDPLRIEAYIRLSYILAEKGLYDDSEKYLTELSEKFPEYVESRDYLMAFSNFYKKKGDVEKAKQYLESVKGDECEQTDYLLEYGESLYLSGDYEEALLRFKSYVKQDITNLKVIHYMCEIYFNKEKYDAIINLIDFVKKNIRLDDKVCLDLGKAFYYKKNYEKCVENLKESLRINPNNGEGYYYLGKSMVERKKYNDAVMYFEKAVLMNSDIPQLHIELALAYKAVKRYNEAISKLQQLKHYDEYYYKVIRELGYIYIDLNLKDKALEMFDELYENKEADGDVLYTLSTLYKEKDAQKSLKILKEIENQNVSNKNYYFDMAELYIKTGDYKEAAERLDDFISKYSEDYMAYYLMGELHRYQELYADAINFYEKAISFNPACYNAYKHLSMLVANDEAKKDYIEKYRAYVVDDIEAEYYYLSILERLGFEDKADILAHTLAYENEDTNDYSNYLLIARVFSESKKYKEALEFAVKAGELNRSREMLELVASINFKLGNYTEAILSYKELLEFSGADYAGLNKNIGDCYFDNKNIQEAIKYYKKAVSHNPEHWDAYKGLAACYEHEGMYEEAISILENILTYYPNNTEILMRTANICEKEERFVDSSKYLMKILKNDRENHIAKYKLAKNYFRRDMYRESIDIIGNLLEEKLSKDFEIKMRTLLTDIYLSLENYIAAEKELKRLIEYRPESLEYLEKLALCNENSGKVEDSLRIYQEIINKDKTRWNIYLKIGDVYFKKGYLDKSLIYYKEAMKFEESEYIIYFKIGKVFEDKEILDKAIAYYKQTIKFNNDFEDVYYSLADIYNRQGMVKDAIELYERLIKTKPDCHEAYFRLAKIFSKRKQFENAMENLEKLVEFDRTNPSYHLELAKIYHILGKTDEAISESIQVVNLAPIDSDEAREAQEMLKPENARYSGV